MKAIVQTPDVEGENNCIKRRDSVWFAVSSPLIGVIIGLLGAWFATLLSA